MVRELFGAEPDPWQVDFLEAYPHNQRLAAKAPLAFSNIIPTPTGMRRWGDIQIGDTVFAEDGSPTRVIRRFDCGKRPIYRVIFRDETYVRVCANHEWKIQTEYDRKRGDGKFRKVTTRQLASSRLHRNGGGRTTSIPIQGAAEFPEADLPLDAYLFGLWLGDGVRNEPTIICPDSAIRQEISARGFSFTLRHINGIDIRITDANKKFIATGVNHLKSYQKIIPDNYKMASVTQRFDLLRGLMDADGTVADNGHTYLATSSLQLVDDFSWLARSLGYVVTVMGPYEIIQDDRQYRDSYRVALAGANCPFLAKTSKQNRWRVPVKYKYTRFIDRIEADGEEEAMCITVAHKSHTFLANDFIVTSNCKGPGKTTVLSWIAWNFLLTRPFPRIAATSISADNLSDTLWPEMAKWQHKSSLLTELFTWTKTRITHNEHPEIWWMSARSWSKSADKSQQSNTLAGLHEDYIMFLLDESGGIPDAVMTTAEAALSSCVEGHVIQAGNPTMLEGPLYRACTEERYLWHVIEITGDPDNPKRSPRIKVEWANEEIKRHGRDNPWVLINVFGEFPPSSINALIGPEEIKAAMARYYREFEIGKAAKVLGVDVARYGADSSVIAKRHGIQAFPFTQMRNLNSTEGASWVNREWDNFQADACFVDDTGGFGSGWIDQLRNLGRSPIGVVYSRKAAQSERYYNKRSEMYFTAVEWIKNGGALPECPELLEALTKTTYTTPKGLLLLEPKELVKEKLKFSPDHADAFVQTFAETVTPQRQSRRTARHTFEYDPFASENSVSA